MVNLIISKGDNYMPRKKKTEENTTVSVEEPKKEVVTTTYSPYGSEALREKAMLKKPTLRGTL